ncbi:MAG: hypothetical protein H0X30_18605 [Anaerolineae bacterium]|nr:hypothetical protein [Anaerolineae bacterium]
MDKPKNDFLVSTMEPEILTIDDLIQEAREQAVDSEREKAFKTITKALKMDASNTEALWLYATLNPNKEKAISALKKLLSIDPEHPKARGYLKKLVSSENALAVSGNTTTNQNDLMARMLKNQEKLIEQQSRQPIINIHNQAIANSSGTPLVEKNQTAYIIGLLAGIFFCTFGVAHIINGKVGSGIVNMLVGWVLWPALAGLIVTVTFGFGLLLVIPMHIALAHSTAKKGARTMFAASF